MSKRFLFFPLPARRLNDVVGYPERSVITDTILFWNISFVTDHKRIKSFSINSR
jgi:hypothetical protein